MGQSWRRLRRTLGWSGGLTLLIAPLMLAAVASGEPPTNVWNSLPRVVCAVGFLVVTARAWGRYQRSADVRDHSDVVPQLVASHTEFALLLRPFGGDGEVLVPVVPGPRRRSGWATPWMTMEQVVTGAVRDSVGMDTYALVDSGHRLAPPGPVYVSASHDQWRVPVRALIRRAHTVVLMLPPGQALRPALEWEVAEIIAARRQSRVVIVLPPSRRDEEVDDLRLQGGAVLVALTRRRPLGSVTRAQASTAASSLPPDTVIVGLRRDGPDYTPSPWYLVPDQNRRRWARKTGSTAAAEAYRGGLEELLRVQRDDWARTPFDRRYPWHAEAVGSRSVRQESGGSS
jgi:hypothetical protein